MDNRVEIWLFFAPAIGIWAAVMAYRARRRARESISWPTTSGIITESTLVRGGRSGDTAHLVYLYHTPEERRGTGLGPCGRLASDPEALVRRYPKGEKISVRYNPERPEISFVDSGDTGQIRGLTFIAVFGISFPLVYFAWVKWLEST